MGPLPKPEPRQARPPRALAAVEPALPLDTLFARTLPPPGRNAPRPAAPTAPRQPIAPAEPRALILVLNCTTCANCGQRYRAPNRGTLVRYDAIGHEHSIQYTRDDVARFLHLPRETREHHATVPFCEACF